MRSRFRISILGALALAACVALAACGSSSSSTSASANTTGAASATSSGSDAAGLARAKAVVQNYSTPTPFPVDKPLLKKPVRRFGYLDCAAPVCGVLIPLFKAAAKTMGVSTPIIAQAGGSASDLQSGLSTILDQKPAALLLPAVSLGQLGDEVSKYKQAGVPISAAGIMAGPSQGIAASAGGPNNFKVIGTILADWTIAKVGTKAKIAWYYTPELDFSPVITTAFKAEVARNCPSCTVRTVPIPLAQDGSTAPHTIVSDLQSHQGTSAAIFANLETAIGLPAALKVANIHIPVAGGSPIPQSLQDMKSGDIGAAVAFDFGGLVFTEMDAAARLATHEPLTSDESAGLLQDQLITKANLTGDHVTPGGYSPTPDYAKVFAKLWANAKSVG
jgi:ribose transport system substrate-binding protein